MTRLAVVVTDNFSAWNFRRELLKAAVAKGLDTTLVVPSGPCDSQLRSLGIRLVPVDVDRLLNPVQDLSFLRELKEIFQDGAFDIVHNISIKPNVYGSLAARLAGIRTVVASVTGLGNVYLDEMGLRYRAIRPLATGLYRLAFRFADRVWFQNGDDVEFFMKAGMVQRSQVVLIRGSGVNVEEFSAERLAAAPLGWLREELRLGEAGPVFSMVTRTLWSKGIREFLDAAAAVAARLPSARFLLVGAGEAGNPQSVPEATLRGAETAQFRWLGWRTDVREILAISDVVVLLPHYREGVPKSLLEALAMGKPVVTTNVPGCREVVEDGTNGLLVPPRDVKAVTSAFLRLATDDSLREKMGRESRRKALSEFDVRTVNQRILHELYGLA